MLIFCYFHCALSVFLLFTWIFPGYAFILLFFEDVTQFLDLEAEEAGGDSLEEGEEEEEEYESSFIDDNPFSPLKSLSSSDSSSLSPYSPPRKHSRKQREEIQRQRKRVQSSSTSMSSDSLSPVQNISKRGTQKVYAPASSSSSTPSPSPKKHKKRKEHHAPNAPSTSRSRKRKHSKHQRHTRTPPADHSYNLSSPPIQGPPSRYIYRPTKKTVKVSFRGLQGISEGFCELSGMYC